LLPDYSWAKQVPQAFVIPARGIVSGRIDARGTRCPKAWLT
jgi:hypothetical protein